ncbi:VanZ family protein [Scopulibacillus cellulosilyticus]|uniref:VanZ family protein n=1 Tax=Scopulibacillus cellulosilyticus TaxID=2665665 RepID=A0ABW2Q7G5_9BACL
MTRNKRAFIILLVIIIAMMAVMFQASNTPYKKQDIKPFLREHISLSKDSLPQFSFRYDGELVTTGQPYDFIEFCIRKLGHISEYAALTFLLVCVFLITRISRKIAYMTGFLLSLLYALSDEWHQSFIPGRTGHLIDVFTFDLFGILLGLIAAFIVNRLIRKAKRVNKGDFDIRS